MRIRGVVCAVNVPPVAALVSVEAVLTDYIAALCDGTWACKPGKQRGGGCILEHYTVYSLLYHTPSAAAPPESPS